MKLSPLKLISYFCTDISFSANPEYDQSKAIELKLDDFSCNHKVESVKGGDRKYQVGLCVKHQIAKKSNSPCSYSVELIGFFEIAEAFPAEKREQAVRVNAPSVLYGIAREIVRSVTAHGPFNAVILPTGSFIEDAGSKDSRPSLPVAEAKDTKPLEMGTKVLP